MAAGNETFSGDDERKIHSDQNDGDDEMIQIPPSSSPTDSSIFPERYSDVSSPSTMSFLIWQIRAPISKSKSTKKHDDDRPTSSSRSPIDSSNTRTDRPATVEARSSLMAPATGTHEIPTTAAFFLIFDQQQRSTSVPPPSTLAATTF
ncbi:hypothetical protein ACLOJK_016096 [Asimina triloba]